MAAARVVSAEMGMRERNRTHGDLGRVPPCPRSSRHRRRRWEAIRQSSLRQVNGRDYVTPDRIEELPDDAIASSKIALTAPAPRRVWISRPGPGGPRQSRG